MVSCDPRGRAVALPSRLVTEAPPCRLVTLAPPSRDTAVAPPGNRPFPPLLELPDERESE